MTDAKQCKTCNQLKPLSDFCRRKASKDGLYAHCKQCNSVQNARYHVLHRERRLNNFAIYSRVWAASKRAGKYGCPSQPIAHAVKVVEDDQEGVCYWCGTKHKDGDKTFHHDHILPLSKYGPNHESNIVHTCPSCNYRKHSASPWAWLAGLA